MRPTSAESATCGGDMNSPMYQTSGRTVQVLLLAQGPVEPCVRREAYVGEDTKALVVVQNGRVLTFRGTDQTMNGMPVWALSPQGEA